MGPVLLVHHNLWDISSHWTCKLLPVFFVIIIRPQREYVHFWKKAYLMSCPCCLSSLKYRKAAEFQTHLQGRKSVQTRATRAQIRPHSCYVQVICVSSQARLESLLSVVSWHWARGETTLESRWLLQTQVWLVCPWLRTTLQEQVIPLEEDLGWSTRRQVVGPGRLWLHQALGFYSVLVFTHHHCFQHRAAEQNQCPHGITICTSPTPTCGVPFKYLESSSFPNPADTPTQPLLLSLSALTSKGCPPGKGLDEMSLQKEEKVRGLKTKIEQLAQTWFPGACSLA